MQQKRSMLSQLMIGDPIVILVKNQPKVTIIKSIHQNTKSFSCCSKDEFTSCIFTAKVCLLTSGEDGKMVWNGEVDHDVLTVTGERSFVISPTSDPDEANIFYFDYHSLLDIGVMLSSKPVEDKAPRTASVDNRKCKVCSKVVSKGVMRIHVAQHRAR